MIEGGWDYVWASYAVTDVGLGAAALVAALRLRHWARHADDLGKVKNK